jgi:hypothetical protein
MLIVNVHLNHQLGDLMANACGDLRKTGIFIGNANCKCPFKPPIGRFDG